MRFIKKYLIFAFFIFLGGCTFQDSSSIVLKIGYSNPYGPSTDFFQIYQLMHPNIEIKWGKLKNNPEDFDILVTDEESHHALSNQLHELETLSPIDWRLYVPFLKGSLEKLGRGKVRGFSPFFSSQAILLNEELFEKAKVSLPHKEADWSEILKQASALTKALNIPAIVLPELWKEGHPCRLATLYGISLKLSDKDQPEWKEIFAKIVDLSQKKIIPSILIGADTIYVKETPIVLGDYETLQYVKTEHPSWKAIPIPRAGIKLRELYAISKHTKYPEESLKFIQEVMGENHARDFSTPYLWNTYHQENKKKYDYQAFTQGDFEFSTDLEANDGMLDPVIEGTTNLEEALTRWKMEERRKK